MAKEIILKKDGKNLSLVHGGEYIPQFTIPYDKELNPAQLEAVEAVQGSYLIIAGAGTGKTRTLIYRVSRLIELGHKPESILLLTFTRKAAKEMLSRASVLLDHRCSRVQGGTFHSFANSILRKYSKAAGLEAGFTILDQGDSEDVINLLRTQSGITSKEKRFPTKQTLNKIFSLSVNMMVPVEDILFQQFPHFLEELEKILVIQKLYEQYKTKNSLLDYDDLLIKLKNFLIAGSAPARALLQQIEFVMVDEYQDTNRLQAELVKALTGFHKNIMAVGDDAQSIYSFRGANFKNIMDFPKIFPGTKVIKLEENYRSTPEILEVANKVHEQAIERYDKELYTKNTGGDLPALISADSENFQSRFIVAQILELQDQGVSLNEIAVLFRSSFFSFDLEIELNKANIPFIKYGGMKFIEAAHIKDVMAFIRVSLNPRDQISWLRLLLLHEGIGPKTAQKIIEYLDQYNYNYPVLKEFKKIPSGDRLEQLLALMERISSPKLSPLVKCELIVEYYYPLFRTAYDDFHKRKKDLDTLLGIVANYNSTDEFLSDMAIEPPTSSTAETEETDKNTEYLTLSTIHSAKGLEWKAVFVINALEGMFPSLRASVKQEDIEEELRLMYVAVTRAKRLLYISYPMNIYERETGSTLSHPSRFIAPITEQYLEVWKLKEE